MTQRRTRRWAGSAVAVVAFQILLIAAHAGAADKVSYLRDIRPILSDRCYQCHGPDKKHREADLRLDQKESAMGEAESGEIAVVPGDAANSELIRRILGEGDTMPPEDSGKKLSADEKRLLQAWIDQGATWQEHWAYTAPSRPPAPVTHGGKDWAKGLIDQFILARLEAEGLKPSPVADKRTLIRRVTFDLTGLPATVEQVDSFLADNSPQAFEHLVDRLLASPRYGEHMARFWLDAARYGDTHGLHLDNYREMWPYRDWVVRAFNDNMPFHQFVIEQLAGDLLPNATVNQRVASGFNRCNVTTNEGGSIKEEVYVRNVKDRVVTVGTVFMGLTLECTSCHDHKYDPLTMKDFYSLFAFFNSLDGNAMDGNKKDHAPIIRVGPTEARHRLARIDDEIAEIDKRISEELSRFADLIATTSEPPENEPKDVVWIDDAVPAGANAAGGWQFVGPPAPVHAGEKSCVRTATGAGQHYFSNANDPLPIADGDVLFAYVYLDPKNPPKQIMLQWNDGDWEHRAYWGGNHINWGEDATASRRRMGPLPPAGAWTRLEVPVATVGLDPGAAINGWAFTQFDGTVYWDASGAVTRGGSHAVQQSLAAWDAAQRTPARAKLPKKIATVAKLDPADRNDAQQKRLRDHFIEHVYAGSRAVFDPLHKRRAEAVASQGSAGKNAPISLVFKELAKPRPAYILDRGEYNKRLDEVPRATPAILPPMPKEAERNRLGLARWLVNPSHPLTARVTVNRFWQQLFGTGLVKTAEDFGSQGEVPSHPELLDWLAVQLIADKWNVKATMKRIVMSATYQQSSRVTPSLIQRDPYNRLLAHGSRFRLDAEMLRDQALATSGLLVNQLGGPSVKPPQPDGLWFAVGFSNSNTVRFKADTGPSKVHRRTLYTFMKRTAPPPQMSTFDAPSRESCSVRRERTNTPLQALLMLNDPQYFEAARALAGRAMREGGDSPQSRIEFLYRVCTARRPTSDGTAELVGLHKQQLTDYAADTRSAQQTTTVGTLKPDADLNVAELASWTLIANLMLNLDEVVNKN